MKCCAICGIVEFNHQCKQFSKMNNVYNKLNFDESRSTPYGIDNCLLSNDTTTSNGENMILCFKCYNEYDAPTYGKNMFFFQSPTYMKDFFIKTPIL
jgi:hypothetical protein